MKQCSNKTCREAIAYNSKLLLCPSCRYMGKVGIFAGGLAVGIVAALLKLFKLL